MKKILFIFVMMLLLTGCSKGKIIEITFDEYNKKVTNEESFVLVVGSTGCNHCANYRETLKEVIEDYEVEIYYIDRYNFTNEQKSKFLARINFDNNDIMTPTTVCIENGREKSKRNRLKGEVPKQIVIEYLKEMGLINESK